jgi:tetratricopeptide (TPR) repeat protein
LYETVTGEEWSARFATKDRVVAPIAIAIDGAFNYGSLHYWQHHQPMTVDPQELAEAFSYFRTNASEDAVRTATAETSQKIRDGRHPVGGNAFIKLGSFMASKLVEKNGRESFTRYFRGGAIPFFLDYVRLYKSDPRIPAELRFTPAFETLIERWNTDWTRTWNDYTQNLELTPTSDFAVIGPRLKKEFAGAEVFPDFSMDLQRIQQGEASITATKLGVDLYPTSDELLFNLGYFLTMAEQTNEGRAAVRKLIGDYERPLVYFRRAFEVNPRGVMAAGTFLDLGRRWLRRPEMQVAAIEFVGAGITLHPKNAALHELLGDLLLKKGQTDQAMSNFRTAYQLDPKLGKGASIDEYVAARMKAN